MRRDVAVGLLLASLGTGCARSAVVESGMAASKQEIAAEGTVRQIGSDALVRTVVQGDTAVVVVGEYESELARVIGAQVRIRGLPASKALPEPAVEVTAYDIVSVDGASPLVGLLTRDARGHVLVGGDGLERRLSAVSERLAGAVGAKVWVVTGSDGSSVARYGILRDPPAAGAER